MKAIQCSNCGSERLAPGFIEDTGDHSRGHARWVQGALELGIFGGAKRKGRVRWLVDAYRCEDCTHLDLFAGRQ